MTRILGLDPGLTTGWAIIEYTNDTEPDLIDYGQIPFGHIGFIKEWHELPHFDFIVCESFTLREGIKGVNIEPTYVIGALEALLHEQGKEQLIIYQMPSYKTLCDNEALKRLDAYMKGKQHARDAARHAIVYLKTKIKHKPTIIKGWPDVNL